MFFSKHCFLKLVFSILFQMFFCKAFASTLMVANKSSMSVSFLNDASQEKIQDLVIGRQPEDTPHEIAVDPSGRYALVSHYGKVEFDLKNLDFDNLKHPGSAVTLIDVVNRSILKKIKLPEYSSPHGIVFLSDRLALVTAEGIQSLIIIDIFEAKVTHIFPIPGKGAHLLSVDKNKQFAYVANKGSGTVLKFDLSSGQTLLEQKIGKSAEGIILTSDSRNLLVTNMKSNTLTWLNTEDLSINKQLKTGLGPIRITIFDNGLKALLRNTLSGTAQVVDLNTQEVISEFKTTNTENWDTGKHFESICGLLTVPVTVLVREDMHTAYIANSFAGNISLIDLNTGKILKTFQADKEPDGMAISYLDSNNSDQILQYLNYQQAQLCVNQIKSECVDEQGFRKKYVKTAFAIINAQSEKVWDVIMDIENYPKWNTFMPRIVSNLHVGDPLTFTVNLDNGFPTTETVQVLIRNENQDFCWGSSPLGSLMTTQRCKHIYQLSNGKTIYFTTEKFMGSVAEGLMNVFGNSIQDGIRKEATELTLWSEYKKIQ